MWYFIFYSILWLITLIYYRKEKKQFDSGLFILGLIFFFSLCSVLLLKDTMWGHTFPKDRITIWPLIYLYLITLFTLSPILKYDQRKIKRIRCNNYYVIEILSIIFIVATLVSIPAQFSEITNGISSILSSQSAASEIYSEMMENSKDNLGDGGITNLPAILTNLLGEIICIIFAFNLASGKSKKLNIAILIGIVINIIKYLAISQRGPVISLLLIFIVSFLSLNRFYSKKVLRFAKISIIVFVVLVAIPFVAITLSRFGKTEGIAQSSVLYYTGQQNVYFDIYAFDNNGIRYGDRVVPVFKKAIGIENVPNNFWERRQKYPNLRINDEVFTGYVGDVVLDFGPISATIIMIILTIIVLYITKIRNNILEFKQLMILQIIMILGTQGVLKLYPFADFGCYKLIMYGLTYFALSLKVQQNQHKFYYAT